VWDIFISSKGTKLQHDSVVAFAAVTLLNLTLLIVQCENLQMESQKRRFESGAQSSNH
jgi:hypothetical protein